MKKHQKKKKKLQEKVGFDSIVNADSMWNRQSSIKKAKNGKTIQQILGFGDDDRELGLPQQNEPMKMMDLVLQNWEDDAQKEGEDLEKDPETEEEKEEE